MAIGVNNRLRGAGLLAPRFFWRVACRAAPSALAHRRRLRPCAPPPPGCERPQRPLGPGRWHGAAWPLGGAAGEAVGELVFNTAMSGYQEIITDPSYRRQLLTFTCPHIGNVGVNPEDEESAQVHAAALVLREPPSAPSNYRAKQSLCAYLRERGVPAIAGVDTRALAQRLREGGAVNAYLHCLPPPTEEPGAAPAAPADPAALPSDDEALAAARAFPGLEGMDLAREVTVDEVCGWEGSTWTPDGIAPAAAPRCHVVVVDFGVKRNILRLLVRPRLPPDAGAGHHAGRRHLGAGSRWGLSLQRPRRPSGLRLCRRHGARAAARRGRRCSASASATKSWRWLPVRALSR